MPIVRPQVVLIIADDAAFSRDLLGRWQTERMAPGFTVMSAELFQGAGVGTFDLVILGPVRNGRFASILQGLETGPQPVICVLDSAIQMQTVRTEHPRMIAIQQHEAWLETVLLLGVECLKRADLTARLRQAEQAAAIQSRNAALGRYMLENRHGFNNLLTSVLCNSELMLEGCSLPSEPREQLETIHRMALHMHEIMQRFSSIAVEMQVAEKSSQDETSKLSHLSASAS